MSRRPTSARPSRRSPAPRRRNHDDDLVYECKAAYMVLYNDVDEKISSRKQLVDLLQQSGRNPTKKMIGKYWTEDTDSLSFDEFVDICSKESATTEDDLIKAFKKIDINGDGYIDNSELKRTLTTRGERMTTAEVQEIIDEVDEDNDGRLDYQEFSKMLLSTQKECQKLAREHLDRRSGKKDGRSGKSNANRGRMVEDEDSDATLESDEEPQRNGKTKDLEEKTQKEETKEDENPSTDSVATKDEETAKAAVAMDTKDEASAKEVAKDDKKDDTASVHALSVDRKVDEGKDAKTKSTKSALSEDTDEDDVVIGTARSGRSSVISNTRSTLGSTTSLRSTKSDRSASPSKLKPRPRPRKRPDRSPDVRPSPRTKERTKSPIAGKDLKLTKPKRIKDWKLSHSKGCFFFDDDNKIISHQYEMSLSRDTSVWITIEPFSIRPGGDLNSAREVSRSPVDTMLFILRDDDSLVTLTEQRDLKGRYGVRCDLERGRYRLIPFTTGCRFRPRTSEPSEETKLVKKSGDKCILTKAFKEALNDIFELCDLDGNGCLSRQEFNFFNLRTSGEAVNDTEWEVVEDKLELQKGEITRQGFIQLNQMEADDNDGDTEELWVTLESMGFSKNLTLDEVCPFFMEIYSESCEARLKATDLEAGGVELERAIIDATTGKGESAPVRGAKDVNLHTNMDDFRACLVLENKSSRTVKVSIDTRRSDNATHNTPHADHTVSVPARSSTIAQHLMPTKETKEWTLRCQESVIK